MIFLQLPNINHDDFYTPIDDPDTTTRTPTTIAPIVIQLQNATFEFDSGISVVDFRLQNISLTVRSGQLICVDGALGAGKTALLDALLGTLQLRSDGGGAVRMNRRELSIGYVAQSAWLQRATLRENIVWGAVYDEQRYKQVLFACALVDDLQTLGGDRIGVGEGGFTLSGGQRARVALARAVYQDKMGE